MTAAPTVNLSHDRIGRITGSRVSAILGASPYRSRDDVLREMVREYHWAEPEFKGNIATRWGNEHEAEAVAEYELATGVAVSRAGVEQLTVIHPKYNFIAVTPDGLVGNHTLLEVKCPFAASYTSIDDRPDYRMQVQLQMETTGRKRTDFAIWRPNGMSVNLVEHDPFWLPSVMDELAAFIDEFRAIARDDEASKPFLEPLVDLRTDDEWADAAYLYLEAKAAGERAKAAEAEAKAKLVALAGDKTTRGGGVLAVRTKGKKGSVSYQKALQKFAPTVTDDDLEEFRSEPSAPSFTIRRTGDKA